MCAASYRGRNDIRLMTTVDGETLTHFRLREFENRQGLAMVHASVPVALERVRRDLCAMAGEEVWVIITDAVRTEEDLNRLAARLGWTDEGGGGGCFAAIETSCQVWGGRRGAGWRGGRAATGCRKRPWAGSVNSILIGSKTTTGMGTCTPTTGGLSVGKSAFARIKPWRSTVR